MSYYDIQFTEPGIDGIVMNVANMNTITNGVTLNPNHINYAYAYKFENSDSKTQAKCLN